MVLVQKNDKSLRFCIDYRRLNAVTHKYTFPLPRIDDLLDQMQESLLDSVCQEGLLANQSAGCFPGEDCLYVLRWAVQVPRNAFQFM